MQQLLQFDSMSDLVAAAAETPLKKTRLNTMRTRQERIELDEEEDVALRKYLVGAIRGLGDFTGCLSCGRKSACASCPSGGSLGNGDTGFVRPLATSGC